MADDGLVIGCDRPMLGREQTDGRAGRRWPTTVHAVGMADRDEPFRTSCGAFVLFRYASYVWPPELAEDWCPGCVRATDDRLLGSSTLA